MSMSARLGRKKSKNVSYFSHEFIISNHGDIVSLVAMFIVLGLMYRGTNAISSAFIFIHHNVTGEEPGSHENHGRNLLYRPGKLDLCVTFFYVLICIVLHAVLQEYVLDKLNRKLNLTRLRLGKFNESGQLACFYALSAVWIAYILGTEGFITSLNSIWEGYPHHALPFWIKLFYIIQICYWLHMYPELYFQRVKKDEIPGRLLYITLFLMGTTFAYVGGLSKIGLILLFLHYSTDVFLHLARAINLAGYSKIAYIGFTIWNIIFIPVRMACTILAFLTFHYGLAKSGITTVNIQEGNYNTRVLRINAMLFIGVIQAFMVWNFITFHQSRRRKQQSQSKPSKMSFATNVELMAQKRKEKKKAA